MQLYTINHKYTQQRILMHSSSAKRAQLSRKAASRKKKTADWYQPDAPPFTKEEREDAEEGQLVYPKIVRKLKDDPVPHQGYSIISFMKLPEVVNGVSHFAKCRGSYNTEDEAAEAARELVRTTDSLFKMNITKTGTWVPVTTVGYAEVEDVVAEDEKQQENADKIVGKAVKEAEKKHKKIARELDERKKLIEEGDSDIHEESLEYYIQRKVSFITNTEWVKEAKKRYDQCLKNREKMSAEIAKLDEKFPEYSQKWLATYNEERAKSGFHPYSEDKKQLEEEIPPLEEN